MTNGEYLKHLIRHYQNALLITPDKESAHARLAEIYYESGDLAQAIETCQKALHSGLQSMLVLRTLTKIIKRLGYEENEIANFLDNLKTTAALEDLFLVFINVLEDPNKQKCFAHRKVWKNIHSRAYASIQEGNFNQALSLCTEAINLEPSLPFPHLIAKYWLLSQVELLDSLHELYASVVKLPTAHRLAHNVFGDILTAQGQIPEAITAYKSSWSQLKQKSNGQKRVTSTRRSIDYLIIGIGKAGTTSLFHYLSQHPKIINPITKEISFFSEKFYCGLDWYMAQFPPLSYGASNFVTGETNPWYLGQPHVIEQVFSLFPNIKLIAILRNPGSRVISHFHMARKLGLEQRSLKQAIENEIAVLKDAEDPTVVAKDYWKTERGYLWNSFYLPFLKKWMSVFPRRQLLIVNSDDLYHHPSQTLNNVFRFLGLDDFELVNHPKMNQGSYAKTDYQVRQALSAFFYEHNQNLEHYLNIKFGWNDQS